MKIGGKIRAWYEKNQRDLPWRGTHDPYRIWLSEVILQQTRVDQGLDYYYRFLSAFPDVAALAAASEDEVLKLWQGLGYYSRARNLHHAAREIVDAWGGRLPDSYEGWLKVKGVGAYTASAIASICFGEPHAVVDGNVSRVIARLYGVESPVDSTEGAKEIAALADCLLNRKDPGTHNQAMMEFGALQCVPRGPDCNCCTVRRDCQAFLSGRVELLPVKRPKKRPVDRFFYYYIMVRGRETILTRREENDIWRSLYQFPVVESEEPLGEEELLGCRVRKLLKDVAPEKITIRSISDSIRHQLTHRTIHARFIHVDTERWPRPMPDGWIPILTRNLDDFPVPRLINRYMEVVKF
ncbi:MAG: A/G-specific adenine glycosylase [Bacteroidales bacterium]